MLKMYSGLTSLAINQHAPETLNLPHCFFSNFSSPTFDCSGTSLILEALILLNRLVSNSGYSAIVLRIVTARRDMATLTIDIASRLSQEDQSLRLSDVDGHVKESEIVELGQVFKKRVFAYF
ncbi:hypothetical protein H0E87_002558 [Populus deltoides]|uniref:Uncharacterized protein n=1 Tax=Populus deltoides TaxID=3696 RepID=A0A8T2ZVH8_POPDE|nr:hypothetical protein H0E87_002558 [Populus deltoides]